MPSLNLTVTIRVRRGWVYVALLAHYTAGALIALARLCNRAVEWSIRKAAVVEGK